MAKKKETVKVVREKKPANRPVTWTEERIAESTERIFNRIHDGESCRSILDGADRTLYPSFVTFCEWLENDAELAKHYARVCTARESKIFDEILTIADSGSMLDEPVNVQRDRLKIDARKWVLSKMAPKKYGDKMEVDNNLTVKSINLKDLVSFK